MQLWPGEGEVEKLLSFELSLVCCKIPCVLGCTGLPAEFVIQIGAIHVQCSSMAQRWREPKSGHASPTPQTFGFSCSVVVVTLLRWVQCPSNFRSPNHRLFGICSLLAYSENTVLLPIVFHLRCLHDGNNILLLLCHKITYSGVNAMRNGFHCTRCRDNQSFLTWKSGKYRNLPDNINQVYHGKHLQCSIQILK